MEGPCNHQSWQSQMYNSRIFIYFRVPLFPFTIPMQPQLFPSQRVSNGVGTVALKSGTWSNSWTSQWTVEMTPRSGADQIPPAVSTFDSLTDAEIMLRVGAGDDAAFDFLVEKFRRPMISFMYRMVHNRAVAEELAQEVFLRVYRSRTTYAAEAKFTTWLYRIATNLAVNHARDTRQERMADAVSLDEPDEESGTTMDVASKDINAEQNIVRNERLAAIRQHVMELPERQRMAVLMHKYQDMDYRQIADVLKLSESATKSLLFRAYESLRDKLKGFV
jgi:RNA polymerase sigma-70 factor, ECF subfamily